MESDQPVDLDDQMLDYKKSFIKPHLVINAGFDSFAEGKNSSSTPVIEPVAYQYNVVKA